MQFDEKDFMDALKPENWTPGPTVLQTPEFQAALFPDGMLRINKEQGYLFFSTEGVKALTRFLIEHVKLDPLPSPEEGAQELEEIAEQMEPIDLDKPKHALSATEYTTPEAVEKQPFQIVQVVNFPVEHYCYLDVKLNHRIVVIVHNYDPSHSEFYAKACNEGLIPPMPMWFNEGKLEPAPDTK